MSTLSEEPLQLVQFFPGNPLSYATTRVVVYRNDIQLSTATAFVLKYAETYALITNWHVVSGMNPTNGQCLSPTGALPTRIECHVGISQRTSHEGYPAENLYFKPLSIELYENDMPIWLDDRAANVQNDYVAIDLHPYLPELTEKGVALRAIVGGTVTLKKGVAKPKEGTFISHEDVSNLYPPVGADVFVLGYPNGIVTQGIFPIWKRASIASEPQAEVSMNGADFQNAIYIDSLTKSGMSGSPVIYDCKPGNILYTEDGVAARVQESRSVIVGVYAGRDGVTNDEYELSLGRVWKIGAVEQLIASFAKEKARARAEAQRIANEGKL